MKSFYYTGIAIITLFATHSLADSMPVSYWNGPSTSAMNQLVSDFILYNEEKKSSRCPTIQFPSLPGSLIVYKRQVTNLLKAERHCPAKQIFQQDAATLSALQSVDFYAMTAIN